MAKRYKKCLNHPKIEAVCPKCGWTANVPVRLVGNEWPIDDVKCSECFKERLTFVNLVPKNIIDQISCYHKRN